MRVLLTRPLPDGERTAAAIRAMGHETLVTPLMQVRPVAASLAGKWCGVIITSANALRVLTKDQLAPLFGLPLYAVGERSADAALTAGFTSVRTAQGNADDLVRLIAERYANETAPFLYLAGEHRAADIEGALAAKGIKIDTIVVYRNMTTGFPAELLTAVEQGRLDAALHFSRRSAENFVMGARMAGLVAKALALKQMCLSAPVAEPLIAAGARNIAIARRPDEASMLALLRV